MYIYNVQNCSTLFATLLYLVFHLCQLPSVKAGEESELAHAITRTNAVFSGQFQYEVSIGKDVGNRADAYTLTFSGPSWKKRAYRDFSTIPQGFSKELLRQGINESTAPPVTGMAEKIVISHNGREIEYYSTPQPDGVIRKSARVVTGESDMAAQQPPLPQFYGTFVFPETRKFVIANQSNAVRKGVDKINGHEVVTYDLHVPESESCRAFRSVNSTTENGGTLRVFIAPHLGYLITRIEHIGVSGVVGTIITADNFVECNGFYFPKLARIEYIHSPNSKFVIETKIESVSRINEAISDSEFTILLPPGTEVADARDGKHSYLFEVTDRRSIPRELQDVFNATPTPGEWRKGWKGATLLGLALGMVLLGGTWLARWVRRRGASA